MLLAIGAAGAAGRSADPGATTQTLRESIHDLRRAHGEAPPESRDTGLDEAIRRLQTVQLERPRVARREAPPPAVTSAPAATPLVAAAPVTTASAPALPPAVVLALGTEPAAASEPSRAAWASQLLARIQQMPPEQAPNAAALAEALMLAGQYEPAAAFFELAAKSSADEADKAWLLYQTANCKRRVDPVAARTAFRRVVGEHPASPWAPLAEAQEKLLEWYELQQPQALLCDTEDVLAARTGLPLISKAR